METFGRISAEFGDLEDRSAINTRSVLGPSMKNWFDGDKEFVQRQYDSKALVDQAINGALTGGDWETSDGALAKIILADQFARVVYARLPEAFAGEAVALENAYKLIEEKWMEDERVNAAERLFAVMPLLHSEKIADHLTLQSLVPTMSRLAPEDIRDMVVATKFFEDHYLVIKQFGRFPSRNAILCRLNTPEEEAYLSSPDLPGWAKSQMKAARGRDSYIARWLGVLASIKHDECFQTTATMPFFLLLFFSSRRRMVLHRGEWPLGSTVGNAQ